MGDSEKGRQGRPRNLETKRLCRAAPARNKTVTRVESSQLMRIRMRIARENSRMSVVLPSQIGPAKGNFVEFS